MTKCRIEDNNIERPNRVYNVVNLESHNYFF